MSSLLQDCTHLREQNARLLLSRQEEDAAYEREDLEADIDWAEKYLRGEP